MSERMTWDIWIAKEGRWVGALAACHWHVHPAWPKPARAGPGRVPMKAPRVYSTVPYEQERSSTGLLLLLPRCCCC